MLCLRMKNEPWNGSTGVIGYADSKYDTINNKIFPNSD